METIGILFVAIALLILLAVTSMRYGVDSRDGFRAKRGEFVPVGIVWDVPPAAAHPRTVGRREETQPAAAPGECGLAPCAA